MSDSADTANTPDAAATTGSGAVDPKTPTSTPATDPNPNPNPRDGKRRRPMRALGVGMLVALLGFGGGIAGFFAADEWLDDDASASASGDIGRSMFQPTNDDDVSAAPKPAPGGTLTPREIYRAVSPSVVHIQARVVKTETGFFGQETERNASGTGSGFVIDDEGHIVTNAHVIEDATELSVTFGPNGRKVPAELVGQDRSSDIAVIKIDPEAEQLEGVALTVVPFGDSSNVQVGDPVLAIGNPFGLDRTLTTGVVSALQREIPSLNDFQISDVIQTDAAVNPGNSGGPLLNGRGQVIGVNSQIQSRGGDFAGVAFAVPSSRVQAVAEQLIEDGEVRYAWLGVAGGELTPELVKEFGLSVDEGVIIGTVTSGSPADVAGIRGGRERGPGQPPAGGDVITSFDGEQVVEMRELAAIVDGKEPGDKVEVEYVRGGKERSTTVTLGERPEDLDTAAE